MPTVTSTETVHQLTVRVDAIELRWSRDDGGLRTLRQANNDTLIGYGPSRPTVDIAVAGPDRWRANYAFVRYLRHTIEEREQETVVTIVIGIGPLKLYDSYRITGNMIARTVTVENVGQDEIQLWGVRMLVPDACVGEASTCRFEAPGNSVRPRVLLEIAAEQRPDVLPRRFFAPGLRENRALESCPAQGPGLLALHGGDRDETLLCWYYSDIEPAHPYVEGNRFGPNPPATPAVSIGHEVKLAGWLGAGAKLTTGTQYIMPLLLPWKEALIAFQNTWPINGLRTLQQVAPWVQSATIYELHPSFYGGFVGLMNALPSLQTLGINTLYLMPIWEFDNRKGRVWDSNWAASGSIYAILDFEQLDATLGTPEELRALVDAAHGMGMHVLFDLITQGCARTARYVQECPEWFCRDTAGNLMSSRGWSDTYSFDWNNQQFQDYMLWWALDQVRRYDIDGFRVHAPFDKEPNWSKATGAHASATSLGVLRLLDRLQFEIKEMKSDGALLCELYGPVYTRNHDFCYDYLAHHMFFHMALGRISPAELGEWLDEHRRALPPGAIRVCFTETHNTRTLNPLADGMRGSRLSQMLLVGMVLCGFVPMLWHDQERGDDAWIAPLLHARANHPALCYGTTYYNAVQCDYRQIFVVLREHAGTHILGLLNVSPHKRTISLSLPLDTLNLDPGVYHLRDLFSGSPWSEEGRTTWTRDDLLNICLTLDTYHAYGFVIEPARLAVARAEDKAPSAEMEACNATTITDPASQAA